MKRQLVGSNQMCTLFIVFDTPLFSFHKPTTQNPLKTNM